MMAAKARAAETGGSDDGRWRAVLARDAAADGTFVYGVRTTGVYCRPSCPSRRPSRANVTFHEGPEEAEAAGLRACLRCRPKERAGARASDAVVAACRLIEAAEEMPGLEELAAAAGLSPHHFHRRFKAATGLTPKAYAEAHRRARVRDRIKDCATVTEAIHASGYNSSGRFYAAADGVLGMTAGAFRAGAPGEAIRFAVGETSLGALLVAATGKGVAAILLGDEPQALVRELEEMFPAAELAGGDAAFEALVGQVVGLIEAPVAGHGLPLDIRGTAFQQRVWAALRRIPAGTTVSYAELAEIIGAPRAVRAVAGACAANRLAVAIPCHRVVRTGGGLAGYRWGVERKRELVERERQNGDGPRERRAAGEVEGGGPGTRPADVRPGARRTRARR